MNSFPYWNNLASIFTFFPLKSLYSVLSNSGKQLSHWHFITVFKKILFPICKQSLEGCFSQAPHGKGERMDQDIFSHPAGWLFAVSRYLSAKGGLANTGENQYLIPRSGVETCPIDPWFCGCALAESCSDWRTHGQLAPEDIGSS